MKDAWISAVERAVHTAWEAGADCPGQMYAPEANAIARAAIEAFLAAAKADGFGMVPREPDLKALSALHRALPDRVGVIHPSELKTAVAAMFDAAQPKASQVEGAG